MRSIDFISTAIIKDIIIIVRDIATYSNSTNTLIVEGYFSSKVIKADINTISSY